MPAGGVILIDDIATQRGFEAFAERHPAHETLVCPSANRKGAIRHRSQQGSGLMPPACQTTPAARGIPTG
jgi:hypothetical protein